MEKKMNKKPAGYITILPPSWKNILLWVKEGIYEVDVLESAIGIADIVMDAQQSGAKSITINFDGNKIVGWETDIKEKQGE